MQFLCRTEKTLDFNSEAPLHDRKCQDYRQFRGSSAGAISWFTHEVPTVQRKGRPSVRTLNDALGRDYRQRCIACRCSESGGSSANSMRLPNGSVILFRMAFVPLTV